MLLANTSFAKYWIQVEKKSWIDADSIAYNNDGSVNVWSKLLNKGQLPTIENKKIWYLMINYSCYCNEREMRSEAIVAYDLNNNLIYSFDMPYLNEKIIPGSVGEAIYEAVCFAYAYRNVNTNFKVKYRK